MRKGFKMKSGNTPEFKQMGSSPLKRVGSFIEGERATYADAELAALEGKGVTHTGKEAEKKAKSQLKNKEISQDEYDMTKTNKYKGPGGKEQKAWEKAQSDDRKAQDSTEKRAKILKSSERKTGARNKEGYKGTEIKRAADAAFDKKNAQIKTKTDKNDQQLVKGSSLTISNKKAKKDLGTKNKADYTREENAEKRKAFSDEKKK
jgi:hypothetical protein